MKFDYYYGSQADQFSFIRIPRIMLTDSTFQPLSMAAKVLYGVLLDRMSLSMRNNWLDEEKRVYIIYQIGEIQQDLGFTKKKAMELLTELETFGLLEKKRRGHGLPNILYVKSFMTEDNARSAEIGTSDPREENVAATDTATEETAGSASMVRELQSGKRTNGSGGDDFGTSRQNPCISRGPEIGTSRSSESGTQEVPKLAPQEVPKSAPLRNQTYMNQTYLNHISNLIVSTEEEGSDDTMRSDAMLKDGLSETDMSDVAVHTDGGMPEDISCSKAVAYEELIRENISYDDLLQAHENDREMIEGIAGLMLETVLAKQPEILIASSWYPTEVVRSRFLKLNYSHIEYVLYCLKQNTTKVKNIKKYLLAALFNAPTTMDGYYQAAVNHDMKHFAAAQ